MSNASTGFLFLVKIKESDNESLLYHEVLIVANTENEIESRLKWSLDIPNTSSLKIVSASKIKQKIYMIKTTHKSTETPPDSIVKRLEGTNNVYGANQVNSDYKPKLYALGVSTLMPAADESHAIRKVGKALMSKGLKVKNSNSPTLSDDSTLSVEEVSFSSGFSSARDVSSEANKATFVRG